MNQSPLVDCILIGVSDNVEMWGADPMKRRGQPCFSMSHSKTDPGSAICGPYLV